MLQLKIFRAELRHLRAAFGFAFQRVVYIGFTAVMGGYHTSLLTVVGAGLPLRGTAVLAVFTGGGELSLKKQCLFAKQHELKDLSVL